MTKVKGIMAFREDFLWGAATSSYQIEGAAFEDGRGESVWDMLCRKPGAIWRGQNGAVACDHYHRYAEDVDIMRQIGLKAYRFSISWSRVLPEGTGAVSEAGLSFYDRLVDSLLEAGVAPWATLFHWDYPLALYHRGGWLNPDSPAWFADYTALIVDRLSDRVSNWMTLNEPQCFIGLGHFDGIHAPGDKLGMREVLRAGHHALLAHGRAAQVIRARAKTTPQVGYAPVGVIIAPASESEEDIAAARLATFNHIQPTLWSNTWWSDPVAFGEYPSDLWTLFGDAVPIIRDGDMETIRQPIDFYGANIYQAFAIVRAGAEGMPEVVNPRVGGAITLMGWQVVPDSLYWGARFLSERYKAPIVITENGISNMDWVGVDGCVHDPQRIDYASWALGGLYRAASEGIDVRGYFHWSLLDNFEWAEGYKQRFGLVHVDFETQQRTIKDSAWWYRDVIASNGASLAHVPRKPRDL